VIGAIGLSDDDDGKNLDWTLAESGVSEVFRKNKK
jgi:hypothetical protein